MNNNRMVFSTNSNNIRNIIEQVSCIFRLTNGGSFTKEELKHLYETSDSPLGMTGESLVKNLSYLIADGFFKKDRENTFIITRAGIVLANEDDVAELEKFTILAEALNTNYKCNVRDKIINPYTYIFNLFKDLEGKVSKLELATLLFISCQEEYEDLLHTIKFARITNNLNPIVDFISRYISEGKITEEDVRIVAKRDVTRPTFALETLDFIVANPSRPNAETITLPGNHTISIEKEYSLTEKGLEYIFEDKYLEFMEYKEEEIVETNKNEEDWEINNQPIKTYKTTTGIKFKKNVKLAEFVKEKSKGVCFFDEIDFKHNHYVPISEKGKYGMDSHHIIPMTFQPQFETSLDKSFFLIPVDKICHYILHKGEKADKEKLVIYLYEKKKELLKKYLNIKSYNDFKVFYNL